MQAVALAEAEWYAETGSYLTNSEDETCNPSEATVAALNDSLFDDEDVVPDDLGWTLCVASAGSGGSFQIFAEKTGGGAEDVMCLNRNGSIRIYYPRHQTPKNAAPREASAWALRAAPTRRQGTTAFADGNKS